MPGPRRLPPLCRSPGGSVWVTVHRTGPVVARMPVRRLVKYPLTDADQMHYWNRRSAGGPTRVYPTPAQRAPQSRVHKHVDMVRLDSTCGGKRVSVYVRPSAIAAVVEQDAKTVNVVFMPDLGLDSLVLKTNTSSYGRLRMAMGSTLPEMPAFKFLE